MFECEWLIMATKKVKSAGRFKERYGQKTRAIVSRIEKTARTTHECPSCMKKTLKRQAAGIWVCGKCGVKLAGGAYSPSTASGKILGQLRGGKFREVKTPVAEQTEPEETQEEKEVVV